MKPKALSARLESFRDVLYICITTIRFIDGCYQQELDPRARDRNTRLDFSRVMDRSLRAVAGPDFVLQNSCADVGCACCRQEVSCALSCIVPCPSVCCLLFDVMHLARKKWEDTTDAAYVRRTMLHQWSISSITSLDLQSQSCNPCLQGSHELRLHSPRLAGGDH